MLLVLFGVNLGTDAEGKASASFEEPKAAPAQPKFSMDDMDTSGPSETKKPKQEEKKVELIEDPIEEDEGPDNKAEAKKEKEKGNGFYKKKDFENAIKCYDKVIICMSKNIYYLLVRLSNWIQTKLCITITRQQFLLKRRTLIRPANFLTRLSKLGDPTGPIIHKLQNHILVSPHAMKKNKISMKEIGLKIYETH